MVVSIINGIQGSIVAAASPPLAPDLTSNPLVLLLIGSIIGSISPLLVVYITNKQQLKRDQISHKMQLEREKEAYIRSLKDAKIERLRTSFKLLLNTADAYHFELQQMNHVPNPANVSVAGVDEVVNEVTLEGLGADVLSIFFKLRSAFYSCSACWSMSNEGNWEEVLNHKDEVISRVEELKIAMNRNLEELEH